MSRRSCFTDHLKKEETEEIQGDGWGSCYGGSVAGSGKVTGCDFMWRPGV